MSSSPFRQNKKYNDTVIIKALINSVSLYFLFLFAKAPCGLTHAIILVSVYGIGQGRVEVRGHEFIDNLS